MTTSDAVWLYRREKDKAEQRNAPKRAAQQAAMREAMALAEARDAEKRTNPHTGRRGMTRINVRRKTA